MKKDKGMLLLEMLIALSLLTLIIGGLLVVYWLTNATLEKQSSQAEAQYSARHAREAIVKEFVACNSFSVREGIGGNEVDCGGYLHLVQDNRWVDFYVHNNQLYRKPSTSPPGPVAESILRITFHKTSSRTMKMRIEACSHQQFYVVESICSTRVH